MLSSFSWIYLLLVTFATGALVTSGKKVFIVGSGRPLSLGRESTLTKATLNMTSVKQPTSCNPPQCRFKQDTDVNDTQHNMVNNTTSVV